MLAQYLHFTGWSSTGRNLPLGMPSTSQGFSKFPSLKLLTMASFGGWRDDCMLEEDKTQATHVKPASPFSRDTEVIKWEHLFEG